MNMHFRKDEVYSKNILKTINVYILMLEENLTGVYKMWTPYSIHPSSQGFNSSSWFLTSAHSDVVKIWRQLK